MLSAELTESYYRCPSDTETMKTTLTRLFSESTEKYADREAFVFHEDGIKTTFRDLKIQVDKMAAGLIALGLTPCDRLVIWAPTCLEWVVTQYAAIRTGIIYTGLNTAYDGVELLDILTRVNPQCIVCGPRVKSGKTFEVLCSICPDLQECENGKIKSESLPCLERIIMKTDQSLPGVTKLKDVLTLGTEKEVAKIKELENTIQPADTVTIQLTSGTTGCPKAVLLSNYQMINVCYFGGVRMGLQEKVHRICMAAPLFRCATMMIGSLSVVIHGTTTVVPSMFYNPETTLQALASERCTCMFGNMPLLMQLIKWPEFAKYNLSSLEAVTVGGSSFTLDFMNLISEKLQINNVFRVFPMTEAGGCAMETLVSDSLETASKSVGVVLDRLEVKVIDGEGKIVPINAVGELCIRGYATPLGYFGATVTQEAITHDGWFHSGDMFYMDKDGYLYEPVARKKDVIHRGNDVIYPGPIEQALLQHKLVADVQIVGVPIASNHQDVCACVIAKGEITEDDVRTFCEHHNLPIPKYVCNVKGFPRTPTMKVQKYKLAKMMTEQLGLDE